MKKHKTQEERQNLIKLFQESNLSKVNFLFSNTPNGARSSALIYSVIQTAIANGLSTVCI